MAPRTSTRFHPTRASRASDRNQPLRTQGLLALALVGLGAAALLLAGGCATTEHSAETRSDRELAERANEALSRAGLSAGGDRARIEVRCYHGVASLLGEGPSGVSLQAERVVRSVPGIARVNNLWIYDEDSSTASGSARSVKAPILARAGDAASLGR